ncbi:hypothetical protein [Halobellus salinus]|nr:hypothetical protein [Halobellus salinus]
MEPTTSTDPGSTADANVSGDSRARDAELEHPDAPPSSDAMSEYTWREAV